MQATLFYRYGQVYREVLRFPKLDWCQLMSKQVHNLIFAHLIEIQSANFPGTIHECPYRDFLIENRSLGLPKALIHFATGEYKSETYFHTTSSDEYIGEV